MKLVVGLGNPEAERYYNRHNIGHLYIHLVEQKYFPDEAPIIEPNIVRYYIADENTPNAIIYAMPMTGMNDSGLAVKFLMEKYNIQPSDTLIILDEIDLPFGRVRLRLKGKTHHNGLKSIIEQTGIADIPRLRVGVGEKPLNIDTISYVLSDFTEEEKTELDETILSIIDLSVFVWIHRPPEIAMTTINK